MEECEDIPVFTLIFDREAWSPVLFAELWNNYRIAVITYRKNVTGQWDESLFTECEVITSMGETAMKLHEQDFCHEQCTMREVRKLCDDGHQTGIVTTNKILSIESIASHMFARWAQENFFRYMRQEYALDKIIQYSVDNLDSNFKVVNPEYNNISYRIKKEREKVSRRKAKLYFYEQQNPLQLSQPESAKWMKNRLEITEAIERMEQQVKVLINKRKEIPYKIPVGQMPETIRYNRLHEESKALQNIIKMICYRAETAFAALLAPYYKRANQEIRALIKSIIHTHINLEVDRINDALKITVYPLANQRSNETVNKICEILNQTNTIYPGTKLKLIYKITTS
jgi:tRNA A-37 threonylcarbamoyl transferase component Bud32